MRPVIPEAASLSQWLNTFIGHLLDGEASGPVKLAQVFPS